MRITNRLLRRLPEPDYERIRSALMLALADGQWMDSAGIMYSVSTHIGSEYRPAPRAVFSSLQTLTEEGLVETKGGPGNFEHNKLWRLTDYGQDELQQMGAANI